REGPTRQASRHRSSASTRDRGGTPLIRAFAPYGRAVPVEDDCNPAPPVEPPAAAEVSLSLTMSCYTIRLEPTAFAAPCGRHPLSGTPRYENAHVDGRSRRRRAAAGSGPRHRGGEPLLAAVRTGPAGLDLRSDVGALLCRGGRGDRAREPPRIRGGALQSRSRPRAAAARALCRSGAHPASAARHPLLAWRSRGGRTGDQDAVGALSRSRPARAGPRFQPRGAVDLR